MESPRREYPGKTEIECSRLKRPLFYNNTRMCVTNEWPINEKHRNILVAQTSKMQLFPAAKSPVNNNKEEPFALGISYGFCVAKLLHDWLGERKKPRLQKRRTARKRIHDLVILFDRFSWPVYDAEEREKANSIST